MTYTHCAVLCLVTQSRPTLCDLMDSRPLGSSVHGIPQARILERVAMPPSRGSSQPRDQTQVSCIAVDSLPSEPPGKSKNTGVGNRSLLQGIFPTQELNQGLLHYRQILYQLSYQGRPSQCTHVSHHQFVHFKYFIILFVNYTLIKLENDSSR